MCNLRGDLQRETATADAVGGITKTWSNTFTGLAVSVQPYSARTGIMAAKDQMNVTHMVYTPGVIDVNVNDRWLVDGRYYRVLGAGDMGGRRYGTESKVEVIDP